MDGDLAALERDLAGQLSASGIPGFAMAIVEGAALRHAWGWGVTSVGTGGVPVTAETLFCIGSVTKPLTGTAVMQLAGRGALDLDRPVIDYLPELTFSLPGAAAGITARHLLGHTAGLASVAIDRDARAPGDLAAFARDILPQLPFVAPPGRLFSYSNAGLMLAGHLAATIAGQEFADLMRSAVFGPLGMCRTTFDRADIGTARVAASHKLGPDGTLRVDERQLGPAAGNPAGLALSTASDLARFALVQVGNSAAALGLTPSALAEMHRPRVALHTPAPLSYGLTWYVSSYKGHRLVMHPGAILGYVCEVGCFPDEGVAVVTMRNFPGSLREWGLASRIYDRLLGLPSTFPMPRIVPPLRTLWPQHAGTYLNLASGLATIAIAGDRLLLCRDAQVAPLRALREDLYFAPGDGQLVGFVAEGSGPTQHIVINEAPYWRVEVDATFRADPDLLRGYVGDYHCDDGPTLDIRVEDGRLYVVVVGEAGKAEEGLPLDNTRFASRYGLVEFLPGGDPVSLRFRGAHLAVRRASPTPTAPPDAAHRSHAVL